MVNRYEYDLYAYPEMNKILSRTTQKRVREYVNDVSVSCYDKAKKQLVFKDKWVILFSDEQNIKPVIPEAQSGFFTEWKKMQSRFEKVEWVSDMGDGVVKLKG